jgi:hypothetical protein
MTDMSWARVGAEFGFGVGTEAGIMGVNLGGTYDPNKRKQPTMPSDPDVKSEDVDDVVPREEEDSLPEQDPRFHQPSPSPFKRAALIIVTLLLFWLALSMRTSLLKARKAKVIYAPRYLRPTFVILRSYRPTHQILERAQVQTRSQPHNHRDLEGWQDKDTRRRTHCNT